jgi:RimJ/RimL family protein N-acetyltransferase
VHVFLTTDRLILRRMVPADTDHLVELDGDPDVMAFITGGAPTPRAEIEAMLSDLIADYDRFRGLGRYAAIERRTGEFVGWMSLRSDGSDEVDLGYRLRKTFWGKGYATEGARALIDSAFRDHGIERVYAETMFINARSRAVMARVGLRHVRTFHLHFDDPIPGTELGEVEYAITRAEWETAR